MGITNYKGYLLKVNGNVISHKYFHTYKTTPNRLTDKNPWTDGNGVTHRNVLPHKRSVLELTTPPLFLEDKIKLQNLLPDRTKLQIEYWNDEINDYATGEFYIPDVQYEVLMPYDDTVAYRPITFEIIEY